MPHQHVKLRFGEDSTNEIQGSEYECCDFKLKADGGWPEIEAAIAAATRVSAVTKRKKARR